MSASTHIVRLPQLNNTYRTQLQNGLTVIATENPTADIVSARLLFKGGGRVEPAAKAGVAHLLSAVLTKGTDTLSSQDIAEKVESIGASLGADATSDYCLVSFKTVSADFETLLGLTAELVRSPSFPEHEVDLERRLTLQGIRSMQEQPFAIAYQHLRAALYQDHPYASSGLGTEETVSHLTRDDIVTYYHTHFCPEHMVVSLAGRIQPEVAIAQIEAAFGDWRPHPDAVANTVPPSQLHIPKRSETVVEAQDTMQAIVMLGYPAPSVHSEDYIGLKLLTTHLGNGLSSRLFVELREKRGLAYDVSAIYPTRIDWSHFVTYMGTAPVNVPAAIEGLQAEVNRICDSPLTDNEAQVAKNKLLGQYALGKQTNAQIAQLLGWYEILGLGVEFDQTFQDAVAHLSIDEMQAIARRYLGGQPCLSLVGPEAAVCLP
ncbi:MAG: pitrilysin family protein [Elainellaceae cyanobacterium]